jgi:ribonuclease BN (tRNA processing enzyme)
MSEFKVKFRGVRGSYTIANSDYLKFGGNTACVEINAGGNLIVLDAGSGLIDIGNELLQKYISSGIDKSSRPPIQATVLLSHIHQDHIQGFTFFRPLHISTTKVNVFGSTTFSPNLKDELAKLLFSKTFPLELGDIAGNLNIHSIGETDGIVIKAGKEPVIKRFEDDQDAKPKGEDVVITSYRSAAHPQEGVLIYKVAYKDKTLVYATDKESYEGGDKKLASFARNCDLLIHDSQYTTEDYMDAYLPKQGYGHSTFDMAVEAQKQSNAKKLVFFHYDPLYDDEKLEFLEKQFKPYGDKVIFAKEGLEIDLMQ